MTRYFTHYWSNATWLDEQAATQGEFLEHTASNVFMQRGVDLSDQIYIVTIADGVLKVAGKMVVDVLTSREALASALKCNPEELWPASDHAISFMATPLNFNNEIPADVSRQLRFVTNNGETPLTFVTDDKLDRQTLRGVRELTHASALLLDEYLPELQEFHDDEEQGPEA
jgi:hypothetical protein